MIIGRFLQSACSIAVGLPIPTVTALKPGAIHTARWMAKTIYFPKMEILLNGNETVLRLTSHEQAGIESFN
jgi:hypothetical protein